jgi:microcystin-dependent protein
MSEPFIGEIRMFGGSFAPAGWAFCSGQLMPIAENDALFVLLGTTYGGDGQTTFGLPDLQGRVPIHQGTSSTSGTNYVLGQKGGVEAVTLTTNNMAAHIHPMIATTSAAQLAPGNATMATATSVQGGIRTYSQNAANTTLNPASISAAGGGQPHDNMQQTLCVSFIISLFGIYPHS